MRKAVAMALNILGVGLGAVIALAFALLSDPDLFRYADHSSHPAKILAWMVLGPMMIFAGIFWLFNWMANKISPQSDPPFVSESLEKNSDI